MQHRKRTALIAGLFTITCLAQISMNTMSGISADAAGSYDMAVTVNLAGEKKAISPYIYGVNDSGDGSNLKNVTVDAVRQGGNRLTGYNWETNYSNAGEDWHNSSDTNIGDDTDGCGYAGRRLSATCQKNNIPYKMTTLQMAGYVAADKAGTVLESEAAPSSRWKEVKFKKDTALTLEPDVTDDYVYMDEYVNYLVKTLGDSTTSTGIQAYSLDNEPVLWNDTHPLLHSKEVSSSELISKSIERAQMQKFSALHSGACCLVSMAATIQAIKTTMFTPIRITMLLRTTTAGSWITIWNRWQMQKNSMVNGCWMW